ncbi:MAG: hypothetical protein FWG88_06290 [Oscillospiraceae bacterium]|nr:hypothetical protein [Oscillospiraceae bacterium]
MFGLDSNVIQYVFLGFIVIYSYVLTRYMKKKQGDASSYGTITILASIQLGIGLLQLLLFIVLRFWTINLTLVTVLTPLFPFCGLLFTINGAININQCIAWSRNQVPRLPRLFK